ncbi:MAG: FGGY-family carbohydrate kinase, partial [Sphaerochaeta sp.]|nr:FGGY-family carbohydrate kinase [Sphaerochaeta sp.]
PGAQGVVVIPHFKGSGSPYWNPDAKGFINNLSLSSTKGDIARAILEGIALEIQENIIIFEEIAHPVDQMRVSGGMARSAVFNQIQADILQKEVIQPYNTETTSLGAWINASVALGHHGTHLEAYRKAVSSQSQNLFKPDWSLAPLYEQLLKSKRRYLSAFTQ